jgi:predicted dehydrogenase
LLTQIHQIDYLNWLFGGFVTVFAQQVAIPELEIDVESSVTYVLGSEQGVPVVGHLNYAQRPKNTGMEIVGTNGRLSWSADMNSLILHRTGSVEPEAWHAPLNRNSMFIECMSDFLNAIEHRTEPAAGLPAGTAAVKIAESIKKSLLSRAVERVQS